MLWVGGDLWGRTAPGKTPSCEQSLCQLGNKCLHLEGHWMAGMLHFMSQLDSVTGCLEIYLVSIILGVSVRVFMDEKHHWMLISN